MNIIIKAILTLSLVASTTELIASDTIETNTVYFLSTDNDSLATSKLFSILKARGEDVIKSSIDDRTLIWTKKELGKTILSPRMSADSIDRLIVTKQYRVKYKYKHSDVMKEMIWQMNQNYNVGIYASTGGGDLQILSCFPFEDRLDVNFFERFCRWLENSDLSTLVVVDQNFMEYFE